MLRIADSGDESLTLYLAEDYDERTLALVARLVELIRREGGERVIDVVPSYCSLTVFYDPLRCDHSEIQRLLERCAGQVLHDDSGGDEQTGQYKLVELPVYYGEEVAPDLGRVAEFAGISPQEVVNLHAGAEYRVYALGFRPGFAFMGKTPEPLRLPRLDTPRARVPAGSVAIAGAQAAVYPDSCPGGWNLIGRCPVTLFDRSKNPPEVLLAVGDRVRFVPVGREEFVRLGGSLDE
ncbi:5-oxoprolinase subunit PxpB [Microbulbifer yueqingensis]|uniref:Sensor histidine kinase inhibitor, KipI family n=1 Tax=Microbulbifer yueqingensis TaxID=658219 RepID=A0A1G9AN71_9GAMM|nr:5-oxoprolinase subunit PxpB [Microbulbifer yueqingensis]SDK28772.1 sensor histidine kinase inhibitor, KipI family [Microbulbifer yueqingensis]